MEVGHGTKNLLHLSQPPTQAIIRTIAPHPHFNQTSRVCRPHSSGTPMPNSLILRPLLPFPFSPSVSPYGNNFADLIPFCLCRCIIKLRSHLTAIPIGIPSHPQPSPGCVSWTRKKRSDGWKLNLNTFPPFQKTPVSVVAYPYTKTTDCTTYDCVPLLAARSLHALFVLHREGLRFEVLVKGTWTLTDWKRFLDHCGTESWIWTSLAVPPCITLCRSVSTL